eukprot:jgi/Tetstr1/454380/TSEL_041287.t1
MYIPFVRLIAEKLGPRAVIVHTDLRNAYTEAWRRTIIQRHIDCSPLLPVIPALLASLSTDSYMVVDDTAAPLRSEDGVQQGAPLATTSFCVGIYPEVQQCDSTLEVTAMAACFNADDGYLVGLPEHVCEFKTMRYGVKYTAVPRATAVDRFERSMLGDIHRGGLAVRHAAWHKTEPGQKGPLRDIMDMSEYTGMVFGTVGEVSKGVRRTVRGVACLSAAERGALSSRGTRLDDSSFALAPHCFDREYAGTLALSAASGSARIHGSSLSHCFDQTYPDEWLLVFSAAWDILDNMARVTGC